MSPILQSRANASAYGYRSFVTAAATSYESIATTTVGSGGSSAVIFSSIPSTYTHLQLRILVRASGAASNSANLRMYMNEDFSSNYSYHRISGDGANAGANGASAVLNGAYLGSATPTAGTTANSFAAYIVDILDYKDTNKRKTIRTLCGNDTNGNGIIWFGSNLWLLSEAVNYLEFQMESGSFLQYSTFALYGIKAAA